MLHYAEYAQATYASKLILVHPKLYFRHFVKILSRLSCPLFCCFKSCSPPLEVKGDNCCFCNLAVLDAVVSPDLKFGKVVFVSYKNRAKCQQTAITPYAVLRDDDYKSIVITIRGTSDLSDIILDANATPISFYDFILTSFIPFHPSKHPNIDLEKNCNWKTFSGNIL